MHRSVRKVNTDLTEGFHTYMVRWREQGIDWLIDETLVQAIRGSAGAKIFIIKIIMIMIMIILLIIVNCIEGVDWQIDETRVHAIRGSAGA